MRSYQFDHPSVISSAARNLFPRLRHFGRREKSFLEAKHAILYSTVSYPFDHPICHFEPSEKSFLWVSTSFKSALPVVVGRVLPAHHGAVRYRVGSHSLLDEAVEELAA